MLITMNYYSYFDHFAQVKNRFCIDNISFQKCQFAQLVSSCFNLQIGYMDNIIVVISPHEKVLICT